MTEDTKTPKDLIEDSPDICDPADLRFAVIDPDPEVIPRELIEELSKPLVTYGPSGPPEEQKALEELKNQPVDYWDLDPITHLKSPKPE